MFDVTNQKTSPFYDHLPPSPPNTMLNICEIVITRKATLIGGGVGRFHLDCNNKLKNDVITASVVNVLARIVEL